MFAFVDETGNTGSNIFDEAQPDFFTGALITKTNFDLLYTRAIREICRRHRLDSLHASVLGFGPIEDLAPEILSLLKKIDARFFLSRVEKRYLVATKLFDTFFDSGENPAASWNAYNIRPLKLILCFKVATLLTEDIARQFWEMLMARNERQARLMIPGICHATLERVSMLKDQKSRQIVTETLSWARDHPQALDIFISGRQAKNGHMPNMVAFGNLLDGLEGFSKRWNRPLKEIVHDRQSQFEGSLAEWHRIFSNASDEPIHRPGETIVFQKVAGSTFKVSTSKDSAGIQIADLVLWLFRQYLSGKTLPKHSAGILRYVFKKGYQHDFSFDGVGTQLEQQYREIMAKDIPPEALAEGRRIIEGQERRRQELITLYEEDGLMPYERLPATIVSPTDD
ncbi:MAG TPA: DUF3800 domain-containing protein [Pararhizobium sp.]|uniref:DUF3800 domain-containing protein n=1 Tax=Pararhizobium sp. TaxID=1977563 RepID=UPI002BEB48F5|nr:DUF3800 domain-containing protein [Pararhizobium sp.]HTO32459.1 DUF3800 domain-containing protein [Pararhizobium sp.]